LVDSRGNVLVVEEKKLEITDKPVKVYNFKVDNFHTYHVGENRVLVHNANKYVKGTRKTTPKTTLDYLKDIEVKNGNYYASKATIDKIGKIEAKGVDFSKLDSKVMSLRASTEGGMSRVIKYSDGNGIKFIIHEVTDAKGNIIHRDFDAVRIESGQLINKK